MCIVCETGEQGLDFLCHFEEARRAMARATAAMLKCAEAAKDPEAKKRYDRAHKAMARLSRDWNRVEQEREAK